MYFLMLESLKPIEQLQQREVPVLVGPDSYHSEKTEVLQRDDPLFVFEDCFVH